MTLLKQLFGKTVPTSANIAAEIDKARAELEAVRTKISNALAGIATMSDAEHVVAEALQAEQKRAEARLLARIDTLTADHERVLAEEAEAARAAEEAAFAERVKAARAAVENDVLKHLHKYEEAAKTVAASLAALKSIQVEVDAVNAELRKRGRSADRIPSYNQLHRKEADHITPDVEESRLYYVRRTDGGEYVKIADVDDHGNPIPPIRSLDSKTGRPEPDPGRFEMRVVTVRRGRTRLGASLPSLPETVLLPPGLLGSSWHWPRPKE